MMFSNKQLIGIGVAGLFTVLYLKGKAEKAASDVVDAVNPLNQENVFYGGVNALGKKLTGDPHFTLGGWTYEVFNE